MIAVTIHDSVPDGSLAFDLRDILALLPDRVRACTWVCHHVECSGPRSAALHAASESGDRLQGSKLLELADGIQQTIEGTFSAYLPGNNRPWCIMRAIDGAE